MFHSRRVDVVERGKNVSGRSGSSRSCWRRVSCRWTLQWGRFIMITSGTFCWSRLFQTGTFENSLFDFDFLFINIIASEIIVLSMIMYKKLVTELQCNTILSIDLKINKIRAKHLR